MTPESREQQALFTWASYHPDIHDYLIAIPNGGSRHLLEAARLKREGVKAGVSDIFFARPANGLCGLWIELKRLERAKSRITPPQLAWLARMREEGYGALVAHGWEEARDSILQYLNPTREKKK